MVIKVIYTSPAVLQYPYDVELGVVYDCEKCGNKYIIKGKNFNREFELNFIKNMFTPIEEYNWDMLNPPKKNNKTDSKNVKNKQSSIKAE